MTNAGSINLAINAVKNGTDVKTAAKIYNVSVADLNFAIANAMIKNPKGFEGDTFNSKTQAELPQQKEESSTWVDVAKTAGKFLSLPFTLFVSCNRPDEQKAEIVINQKWGTEYDANTKKTTLIIANARIELTEKETSELRKQFETKVSTSQKSLSELKSKVKTFKNKEAIERVNNGIKEEEAHLQSLQHLASLFGGKAPEKTPNYDMQDMQMGLVLLMQTVRDMRQLELLKKLSQILENNK